MKTEVDAESSWTEEEIRRLLEEEDFRCVEVLE